MSRGTRRRRWRRAARWWSRAGLHQSHTPFGSDLRYPNWRDLFHSHAKGYAAAEACLEEIKARLMKWHREYNVSRRLAMQRCDRF